MNDDKIEVVIEDSEETPTDVKRRIKVLEMPVFSYEDKKRVEKVLDKLDKLIEVVSDRKEATVLAGVRDNLDKLIEITGDKRETAVLLDVRDNLNLLASSIQSNEERIISFLSRTVENMENINRSVSTLRDEFRSSEIPEERLGVLESRLNEKLYTIDSAVNYLKGLVVEMSDRLTGVHGAADNRLNVLTENVSEKFDAHISNLNNRLDNMVLQVVEPLNDVSLRLDTLRKDIDSLGRDVDSLKRMKPQQVKMPKMPKIKIPKIPHSAFELLTEARKKVRSKRVVKKKQVEKKRLMTSIDSLQDRVLDLFIFSALGSERKTLTAIKKEIPVSETNVRKRIAELVKRRKVKKIKRGKATFYGVK